MKVLGRRHWYDEYDYEHGMIVGMSWDEWLLLLRAKSASCYTSQWAADFDTHIKRLEIDSYARHGLLLGLNRGDGLFQKQDGSLYDFGEWANLVITNFERWGLDGRTKHPEVYARSRIGTERYQQIVKALHKHVNRLRIIEGQ